MNFYNNLHPYYCGIDLHARVLYVCIIDQDGQICVHQEISDSPDKLKSILEPYLGNIVVSVECNHKREPYYEKGQDDHHGTVG